MSQETKPELTAEDRCDRCGARAYVRTSLPGTGLELLWCAHHWKRHSDKLAQLEGLVVHDETASL